MCRCSLAPSLRYTIIATLWAKILKSAAHAQKHSEARQASDDYDQQADDRLVKAAYDFNIAVNSTHSSMTGPTHANWGVAARDDRGQGGLDRAVSNVQKYMGQGG